MQFFAKGYTNKKIAERLYPAERTVKNRVSLLLGKTRVKNRTQVALWIS